MFTFIIKRYAKAWISAAVSALAVMLAMKFGIEMSPDMQSWLIEAVMAMLATALAAGGLTAMVPNTDDKSLIVVKGPTAKVTETVEVSHTNTKSKKDK